MNRDTIEPKALPTPQLLTFNEVIDERGTLCYLEEEHNLPFRPERTFWITAVPSGAQRGGHAHRTCHEFLVAVCGSFIVECYNGASIEKYHLTSTTKAGLWIPANVWCVLHSFSSDAVCLVIASERYNPAGYINERTEFEAYVNRCNTLR